MNAASLLVLTALTLQAQTTPAPTTKPPAHHRAATPATRARTAAKAADTGPTLPPGIPPAPGKLQTAFTLRYIDIKTGDGAAVEPGQFLTVQYTGWLASNGTKFDSSLDRNNTPFTFPQGMHRVIIGWDQGFEGMHVGGKRRLFIPYQLAYGDAGRPPIPPRSDLIFDIELVSAAATPPAEQGPATPQ